MKKRMTALNLLALALISPPGHGQLLDSTFSVDGKTTIALDVTNSSKFDFGIAVGRVSDGYVTAAEVPLPNGNVGIGVSKIDPSGAYVAGYGNNEHASGRRVKDAAMSEVHAGQMSPYDKMVVVGRAGANSAAVRFTSNGLDDTVFAGDGNIDWDASGIGTSDRAHAVAHGEFSELFWVAGTYDSDPGASIDDDIYLARLSNTGTPTVVARYELGGNDFRVDHVIGLAALGSPNIGFHESVVVLGDNESTDYAGTVSVFDPTNDALLSSMSLQNLLPGAPNCNGNLDDPKAKALVPISERYVAVIGELGNGTTSEQVYVIVLDVTDGEIYTTYCLPASAGVPSIVAGVVDGQGSGFGKMFLAVNVGDKFGVWRWRYNSGLRYGPDPDYNAGQPALAAFGAAAGQVPEAVASAIILDDVLDRPIVVGGAHWSTSQTEYDYDVAVARFHAADVLLRDSFETP